MRRGFDRWMEEIGQRSQLHVCLPRPIENCQVYGRGEHSKIFKRFGWAAVRSPRSFMKISWPQAILRHCSASRGLAVGDNGRASMDNARKIQIFWVDTISRDIAPHVPPRKWFCIPGAACMQLKKFISREGSWTCLVNSRITRPILLSMYKLAHKVDHPFVGVL